MPGFKVETYGTPEKVRKALKRKLKSISNKQRVHKEVSIFLDKWVQKNFKGEGALVGGWPPLVAGGRMHKGSRSGLDVTAKVLQDTGRLRISYKPFATKRNAGIGSKLSYSKFHEEGTGNLPVRRMLPKWSEVSKEVNKIFDFHVKRGIRA